MVLDSSLARSRTSGTRKQLQMEKENFNGTWLDVQALEEEIGELR
jgi:hypothetical protein